MIGRRNVMCVQVETPLSQGGLGGERGAGERQVEIREDLWSLCLFRPTGAARSALFRFGGLGRLGRLFGLGLGLGPAAALGRACCSIIVSIIVSLIASLFFGLARRAAFGA